MLGNFSPGWLGSLRFYIESICWTPWISQFQRTGLPSIFMRAQPCIQINSHLLCDVVSCLLFSISFEFYTSNLAFSTIFQLGLVFRRWTFPNQMKFDFGLTCKQSFMSCLCIPLVKLDIKLDLIIKLCFLWFFSNLCYWYIIIQI